jgi:hypothetical protein
MTHPPHLSVSPPNPHSDEPEDADLQEVMQHVPSGAFALSGLTVGLMLVAWFLIYAFVFLPRGMVS